MPRTVTDGFDELRGRLAPLTRETDARSRHRGTIQQGIQGAYPQLVRVEVFGSHARDTAIRTHSDVDYLAVLRRQDLTWGGTLIDSERALVNCRDALRARFPSTPIDIRNPAVVVRFRGDEGAVDVVPGFWDGTVANDDGYPVFCIPQWDGQWLRTSPQRHKRFIADHSYQRLGEVVRLVKAWKYSRETPVPILALHVELLVAAADICQTPAITYRQYFLQALKLLLDRRGAALQDPIGIGSPIPLSSSSAQRDTALNSIRHAWEHGMDAWNAENRGDIREAFRQWDIVFNGTFPGYW